MSFQGNRFVELRVNRHIEAVKALRRKDGDFANLEVLDDVFASIEDGFGRRRRIHAAGADHDQGTSGRVFLDFVECAVRGEPRTGISASSAILDVTAIE